jgi:hypothetical protein
MYFDKFPLTVLMESNGEMAAGLRYRLQVRPVPKRSFAALQAFNSAKVGNSVKFFIAHYGQPSFHTYQYNLFF